MSILTGTLHDVLSSDPVLQGLLATYQGNPAVFTTDPPPGDASLPYIVTAGEVAQVPFDTKTTRGRSIIRDVRCYAPADAEEIGGSAVTVEAIAERVRALLHRQPLVISGFEWMVSDVSGPVAADERDVYGRILSLSLIAQED